MRNKSTVTSEEDVQDLRVGLLEIHSQCDSWRLTGLAIRVSGAYARLLAYGQRDPSPKALETWQAYMKGETMIAYGTTQLCPSCLSLGRREVHKVPDCGGQPVAQIVILHPGETVRKAPGKPRRRQKYMRPCLDAKDPRKRLEQLARLVRGAVLEAEPHLARIRVSAIHGLRSDRLWDYSQNIATTTHWQIDAYEVDASGAHVTRSWRGVVSQSELFAAIAMTGVLKQVEPSNAWINMR